MKTTKKKAVKNGIVPIEIATVYNVLAAGPRIQREAQDWRHLLIKQGEEYRVVCESFNDNGTSSFYNVQSHESLADAYLAWVHRLLGAALDIRYMESTGPIDCG